jgi:hypothetical protein
MQTIYYAMILTVLAIAADFSLFIIVCQELQNFGGSIRTTPGPGLSAAVPPFVKRSHTSNTGINLLVYFFPPGFAAPVAALFFLIAGCATRKWTSWQSSLEARAAYEQNKRANIDKYSDSALNMTVVRPL